MSEVMTVEQALKAFADDVKRLCSDYSDRQNRPYMADVTGAIDSLAAIHLETACGSVVPRWIAINEHAPDDGTSCLIGCDESDCILMAMYRAGLWFTFDNNPQPVSDVTHWMPLPAPPTQEEQT